LWDLSRLWGPTWRPQLGFFWWTITKATELQPDLILLDIGLPKLNGIGAAQANPRNFAYVQNYLVTECRSADIAESALNKGASGYVVESVAVPDLLIATRAVLRGQLWFLA